MLSKPCGLRPQGGVTGSADHSGPVLIGNGNTSWLVASSRKNTGVNIDYKNDVGSGHNVEAFSHQIYPNTKSKGQPTRV